MKTPGDRITEIERNTNTLMIKALSLKLALSKAEFREEDHPRADDGKFGQGSGSGKKEESSSDAETSPSQENNTQKKTIVFQRKDDPQPEIPKKQSGQSLPIIVRELDGRNGETLYSVEVPFHGVAETVKLTTDKDEAMEAAKKVEQSVRANGKRIREMKRHPPKVNEDLSKFFFSDEE